MNSTRSISRGFTLIELLVVIAIIGLLAAVVLAAVGSARNKGADATVKSQLNAARSVAELYASNNSNSYEGACAALQTATNPGFGGEAAGGTLYGAGGPTGAITPARIAITDTEAGAYNQVTCHDDTSQWLVEAPLTTSLSVTPAMWCVDSTGTAEENDTTVAASGFNC